jgi:flagellar basal-body rod protein FlgF
MHSALWAAKTGLDAQQTRMTVISHNLANVNTTGFDTTAGTLVPTGRELDVAVQGEGYIAVVGLDGREAYTRAGDLRIDSSGQLRTGTGLAVLGDSGPVAVPPHATIAIGGDGTVSIVPLGQGPETRAEVGRIKLVRPQAAELAKDADGLLRMKDGTDAPADAATTLVSGVLETSNVNVADALVNMIELSRRFDLQVRAMKSAEDNGAASARLLSLR